MADGGLRKNKITGWTAAAAGAATSPQLSGGTMFHLHHDMAVINHRIMLRFRPIAPKPATTDGSVSDPGKIDTAMASQLAKQRPKRRYVRVKNNNDHNNSSSRRRCKPTTAKEEEKRRDLRFEDDDVCLKTGQHRGETGSTPEKAISFGLSVTRSDNNDNLGLGLGLSLGVGSDRVAVQSWVVVKGMTLEGGGGGMLGSTDREKVMNLERDTCPGLISDGLHRVVWMNEAYRRMVMDPWVAGETERPAGKEEVVEVGAWLVLKEEMIAWPAAFACTVRVVYTLWGKEKHSKTMPCDVWKMEFGGFAWRLDSKAALCLGL